MPTTELEPRTKRDGPISAWDLPSLLAPLYSNRRTIAKPAKMRPHYAAILAYVYRNRFAIGFQIQRRFPSILRSERTVRRHLEELESLGFLDVVPTRGLGPNFPKVYYVTAAGVRTLRKSLDAKGTAWQPTRFDRAGRQRREGYSAEIVVHELLTTEFLLSVRETVERRSDLELLTVQRRSLKRHPSFQVTIGRHQTRLIPDAMFLFRQEHRGMCCCFLELDNGTMNAKQIRRKFARYAAWAQSSSGQQYLIDLYGRQGAKEPKPKFRLLMIARSRIGLDDERRMAELLMASRRAPKGIDERLWLTTVAALARHQHEELALSESLWLRASEENGLVNSSSIHHLVGPSSRHPLFIEEGR
jgi:Replication-relaxation